MYAIETLEAHHGDAWVASASPDGTAHLVPLSYAWDGTHLILATEETAVTTRNIRSSGAARAALGTTRDVVLIDASLESIVAVPDASDEIAEVYAAQSDWDPRRSTGRFVYSRLLPQRIQVWREEHEISGRTVMRDGVWTA